MRNVLLLVGAVLLLGLGACQGGPRQAIGSGGNPPPVQAVQPQTGLPSELLAELAELAAYPAPAGVDTALFAELKQALEQELLKQATPGATGKGASCLDPFVCEVANEAGVDYLQWLYTNRGDYDFNGVVGISDLVPLSVHFRAQSPSGLGTPFPAGSIEAWVDGDSNGEINVVDIVTIGQHYRQGVTLYPVYRHVLGETTPLWVEMGNLPLSAMAEGLPGGRGFRYPLEAGHAGFEYKSVPRFVETATPPNEVGAPDIVTPPLTSVSGRVSNLAGEPLANVAVELSFPGNNSLASASTDADGLFQLRGIDLGSGGEYELLLTCQLTGYAEACQTVRAAAGRSTIRDIVMLRRTKVGSVSSARGGSAALGTDVELTLPPGGLVSADGTPLTKTVDVNLTFIDPTVPEQLAAAPGNMLARQQDFSTARLETFGMAEVYLDDGSGEPANLAPGQTATLTFPIAESQRDTAPASIGLYSFDMDSGKWVEEGTANKSADGTEYVAEVGHFSYWNCDDPVNPTHIKVLVTDGQGNALPGATVTSAGVSYAGTTSATTSAAGTATFVVETAALERISVEFLDCDLGEPQVITTPAQYVALELAPQVASFALPPNAVYQTIRCQTSDDFAVSYATIHLREASGLWQRELGAGEDGSARAWMQAGDEIDIWATYQSVSSAIQRFTIAGGAAIDLTLTGAHVPPISRFSISINSTPVDLTPLGLTLDATTTEAPSPIAFYHWTISAGHHGPPLYEITETDPVWDVVVQEAGHHFIKLEVTDQFGQTDEQYGRVCVY